jgi:hypothetical protein
VAPSRRTPPLTRGLPERGDAYTLPLIEVTAWLGGDLRPAPVGGDARLAAFPALWQAAVRRLVDALAFDVEVDRPLAGGLGLDRP